MEQVEHNPKLTEYYCQHCKIYITLRAMNPTCECGHTLVVALRSLLDGSRITGNNELAVSAIRTTSRTGKS
jgi:hypothetical protein